MTNLKFRVVSYDSVLHQFQKQFIVARNKKEAEEKFYKNQLPGVSIVELELA